MSKSRVYDNPKLIFRKKRGGEPPENARPAGIGGITSIRRSEIISIAPEEMDPSKVYLGRRPDRKEENPDGYPPR